MAKILIVDDETGIRKTLAIFVAADGHEVLTAASAAEALEFMEAEAPDIVITDVMMPGAGGIDLLYRVRDRWPDTQVIVMTGAPSLETAREAIRAGAFDYLAKPVGKDTVRRVAAAATAMRAAILDKQALEAENERYETYLEELIDDRTEHLRRRVRQMRELMQLTAAVNAGADEQSVLRRIRQALISAYGFDRAGVWLYDDESGMIQGTYGTDRNGVLTDESHTRLHVDDPGAGGFAPVLKGERPYLYTVDMQSEHRHAEGHHMHGVLHHLVLPMRAGADAIGAIAIDNALTNRPIAEEEVDDLLPFAAVAAVAIRNSRLKDALRTEIADRQEAVAALQSRTAEMDFLCGVASGIAGAPDEASLYAAITDALRQSVPCFNFLLAAYSPAMGMMRVVHAWSAATGSADTSDWPVLPVAPAGAGVASAVLRSGKSALFPDYSAARASSTATYYVDKAGGVHDAVPSDAPGVPRSAAFAPLRVRGAVVGLLEVFSDRLDAYTPDHQRLLEAISVYVAAGLRSLGILERVSYE
ncbi:MAG: response regulator [Armatimonadetes bacterium]|nr:response regulator [Armatimonadota bacterium]